MFAVLFVIVLLWICSWFYQILVLGYILLSIAAVVMVRLHLKQLQAMDTVKAQRCCEAELPPIMTVEAKPWGVWSWVDGLHGGLKLQNNWKEMWAYNAVTLFATDINYQDWICNWMDWLLAEDDKILILHYSLYLVSCLDGGGSRDVQLLEEESKDKPLGIHGTVFHGRVDVACILAKELNEWTGRMLVTGECFYLALL
ncbi:hypothetical protein CIHG_01132 [Coccidioides immitis H538.4]|uniref:Uncharacterized protein n=1 Tax=Coccidioides immitis H538.4 TaxID=396776 RepID=A0A0J8RDR9_COCIT|nr:hypothetical protein CIHG_01132 [Coccidioides immitis H538.4]